VSAFGKRPLTTQAGVALLVANGRFWTQVAPLTKTQLRRWEQRAKAIANEDLRSLALEKLSQEHFNSEVAATLATLAPRRQRAAVVEAIVAYEVMYDYLDGLTERPTDEPIRTGQQLYRAFTDAIAIDRCPQRDYYGLHAGADDGGYLEDLARAVRQALRHLPGAQAIADASQRAAARCAEAQIRAHAVPVIGVQQLEDWARSQAAGTPMGWQEFLAGAASSVLAVHALIATAANPQTTATQACELDTVYLSICALSTMLDSLIDYQQDADAGEAGYERFYDTHEMISRDLAHAIHRALEHAEPLEDGAHHTMTLVGVAAYYLSAPSAKEPFVRPVAQSVRNELRPLITPTLAIMRCWRLAKQAKRHTQTLGGARNNRPPASPMQQSARISLRE
jgi:tetraprenyl-beta-curcumene synthase